MTRRKLHSLIAVAIWFLITGSAVIKCSSGDGDNLLRPPGANRAPIADDSSASAVVNQVTSGFMQARDDDGDNLTYTIVTSPRLGSVTHNSSSGAYLYTGSSVGDDSFSFRANDGSADSNIATVRITILTANESANRRSQCRTPMMRCSADGRAGTPWN